MFVYALACFLGLDLGWYLLYTGTATAVDVTDHAKPIILRFYREAVHSTTSNRKWSLIQVRQSDPSGVRINEDVLSE